jgi:hypothetical protein
MRDSPGSEFAFAHLNEVPIASSMNEGHFVFIGNEVSVKVSSSPSLVSIPLVVREICLVNQDLLLLPDVTSDSNDQEQSFASLPSLPYAISDFSVEKIRPKCLDFITSLSNCQVEDLEEEHEDTAKIIWPLLKAIWRFLVTREASICSHPLVTMGETNRQIRMSS